MNKEVKEQFIKFYGKSAFEMVQKQLEQVSLKAKIDGMQQKSVPTTLLGMVRKAAGFDELDAARVAQREADRLENLMLDFSTLAKERIASGNFDLSDLVEQLTERLKTPGTFEEVKARYEEPVRKEVKTKTLADLVLGSKGQNVFVQKMQAANRREMEM